MGGIASAGVVLVGWGMLTAIAGMGSTPSSGGTEDASHVAVNVDTGSPGPDTAAPSDDVQESVIPARTGTLADAGWVADIAARSGIPERALAAYAGAAIRLANERTTCGIDWATLAGIGHVESEHGTLHGGNLSPGGELSPPIYGIPLNGNGVNAIPDTDGGLLDGDTVWDRAVGPMQIIPDTWRAYGVDGNGDGIIDPQHIDDAVLTAGHYLCEAGGDLTTSSGWLAAIAAYNTPVDYNNQVAAATDHYRTLASHR